MQIRIGRISKINYETGHAEVTYPDMDGMVTQELPFLSFEYNMPKIDDAVLVAHLAKGPEFGVIIGKFFTSANKPIEPGNHIWRKDIEPNECYFKYNDLTKVFSVQAQDIEITSVIDGVQRSVQISDIIQLEEEIEALKKKDKELEDEITKLKEKDVELEQKYESLRQRVENLGTTTG